MSDNRREKGKAMFDAVYGGVLPVPPDRDLPFQNLMLDNLFSEVWGREAMSIRDRRLIIIGVIAATADASLIEIQLK
ncbi:MAG: 4-carboxymuconolactone decarboxylase, partial [candidate division NC10 bacterium]|nr:4-carboxymuconolactone decarboxylase [candidate division NC10 bacterium]